jgi:hypothetical protein
MKTDGNRGQTEKSDKSGQGKPNRLHTAASENIRNIYFRLYLTTVFICFYSKTSVSGIFDV